VYEIAKQGGIQSAKREIFTEFCRLSRAILSKLLQILSVADRNMCASMQNFAKSVRYFCAAPAAAYLLREISSRTAQSP